MMGKAQKINELRKIYDMISLQGKKALVTGAAGGIGRSTACAFAELGADVALMDIEQKEDVLVQNAEDIRALYGGKAITITGDVSDPQSVENIISTTVDTLGTIDIVHNNAGIAIEGDTSDITIERWDKIVSINQTGILLVGRAAANIMKAGRHGGSIVNTASISGHIINRGRDGDRYSVGYTATKAAVKHMTKTLAMDYVSYGIRFNSVSPGYILSGLHDGWDAAYLDWLASTVPMKRFGSLDEVIGVVIFLASDLSTYATGTDIIIDGGYCVW